MQICTTYHAASIKRPKVFIKTKCDFMAKRIASFLLTMLLSIMKNLHLFSEKMTPHDLSTPTSPVMDPEEIRMRKMTRRSKVIQELVQTEKDYLTDLELCIREVVQPLRSLQVNAGQDQASVILTTSVSLML